MDYVARETKEFAMRRLAVIAVSISVCLVCEISFAGGRMAAGYAGWPAQTGYGPTRGYWPNQPWGAAAYWNPAPAAVPRNYARPPTRTAYNPSPAPQTYARDPVPRWSKHHPKPGTHPHGEPFIVVVEDAGTNEGSSASGDTAASDSWEQNNLAASQAAVNWQTAQDLAMKNEVEAAKTRDELRRIRVARYRDGQGEHLPAGKTLPDGNDRAAQPTRLGQVDRLTGKILWPEALRGEGFDPARQVLEQLAAAQPGSPDAATDRGQEIHNLTDELKEQLRGQIHEMPPMKYIAARKFLDGLAGELLAGHTRLDLLADSHSNGQ
jgi:hypothetical protein